MTPQPKPPVLSTMVDTCAAKRYPQSKEEAHQAEKALAKAFEDLSFHERTRVLDDIHGVRENNFDDNDDDTAAKLRALQQELTRLVADQKAAAYARARTLDPSYVENEAFRRLFLRAEEFDSGKAAERIALHFQVKRELFVRRLHHNNVNVEDEILVRDVTWDDLDAEDRIVLEAGVWQVCPQPDVAGRTIVFTTSALYSRQWKDESVSRAIWYTLMSCLKLDPDVHVKGVVNLMIHLQPNIPTIPTIQHVARTRSSLPLVTAAAHHCYDTPALYLPAVCLRMILFLFNPRHSFVFRFHFGTWEQIAEALKSFGIPTEEDPFCNQFKHTNTPVKSRKQTWHLEWLQILKESELQKKREEEHRGAKNAQRHSAGPPYNGQPHNGHQATQIRPRSLDVLFGRGKLEWEHPGTVRCRQLVRLHFEEYENASRRDKTQIANAVIATVRVSGGRFLRWAEAPKSNGDGGDGSWVVVEDKAAREKVSHMFRALRIKSAVQYPAGNGQ